MNKEELQIGDWVFTQSGAEKVVEIREDVVHTDKWAYTYAAIKPIPITPEILKKNGFTQCEPQVYELYVKDKEGAGCYRICWQGESYNYYLEIAGYSYPLGEFGKIIIKYVHQLQHALRLCGITLNIEV